MQRGRTIILTAVLLGIAFAVIIASTSLPQESDLKHHTAPERTSPEEIKLVAIQMQATEETYTCMESFRSAIHSLMEQANEQDELGPDTLVAFPEDVGLLTILFGQEEALAGADQLDEAMESVVRENLLRVGYNKIRHGVSWPRALFLTYQGSMAESYFSVFSEMAREYEVYLVAGSAAFTDATLARYVPNHVPGAPPEEDPNTRDVHNVSVVFGPAGEIIGIQRKVRLIDLEESTGLDLVPGDLRQVEPISTSLGNLGVAVCLDAFIDDVLGRLDGADILVQPSANPGPWEPWQQEEWLESAWAATGRDGRFAYAVNPMLTGQIIDLEFYGQSSVITADAALAPEPFGYLDTGKRHGMVAVAEDDDGEHIIRARLPHPSRLDD